MAPVGFKLTAVHVPCVRCKLFYIKQERFASTGLGESELALCLTRTKGFGLERQSVFIHITVRMSDAAVID